MFDFLEPGLDLFLREFHTQSPLGDIKSNDVAVLHGDDRTTFDSFRCDMAGHQAMGGAGEAAVGKQRDGVAQPCADDSRSHAKHFSHAWSAGRTLVPNHHDVARFDLTGLHGDKGILFPVVHLSWATERHDRVSGHFNNTTVRSEIPLQDYHSTGLLDRIRKGPENLLARCFLGVLGLFPNRPAGHGRLAGVQNAGIE